MLLSAPMENRFGQAVRQWREILELTQAEAAKRAGLSVTTWNRMETGLRDSPTRTTLEKMAHALSVPVESLIEAQQTGDIALPEEPTPMSVMIEAHEFGLRAEVAEAVGRLVAETESDGARSVWIAGGKLDELPPATQAAIIKIIDDAWELHVNQKRQ